jgi:hypothetical protein
MVKWYKEQKGRYIGWWNYKWDWLKDHIQLQDVLLTLIILGFIASLFAAKHGWLQLYHGSYTDHTEQLYLFSAIPQSLAAIFALSFSLLLVAISHVGSNYTPRAFRLHTLSIYYFLFFIIFLYTIGYAVYLNGKFHTFPNTLSNYKIDCLELFFFLALAFMIPFSIRAVNLMRPSEIMRRLSWKITERRFNNYANDDYHIDHYLQSLFDIIKACIDKADLRSIEEGFSFFSERFSPFIRRSVSEESNSEISITLFRHYLNACYYATDKRSCYGCIIILDSLYTILKGYKASKFRRSVKIFRNFVERMEKDIERFNNKVYKDQYMDLYITLIKLRDTIIDIIT